MKYSEVVFEQLSVKPNLKTYS